MCNAVQRSATTSVKGCHGSGKTFCASGLVPWKLLSNPEAIVLTIAPTLRQVKTFWNEIHAALDAMPVKLPEATTTGIELSGKNYALGFSSSKGVNAQGFHGADILIIEDEAIGIAPDLHDAMEGIRAAGNVSVLRLCNPTVPQGAPYEDFTRLRSQTSCITISAFDTPNLAGLTLESLLQLPDDQLDYAPFPWLTRRRWVREMYYKWGPTNPRFLSRVLGEFPTQADDAVFQLAWIEKAGLPYDEEEFHAELKRYRDMGRGFIQVGLDISGPGEDETVAYARIGPYVVAFEAWSNKDAFYDVCRFINHLKRDYPGMPITILADVVGLGYHLAYALSREGLDVREFKANNLAVDFAQYQNQKAEAYFRLRELMRCGDVRGVVDEDTKAQLATVRYREKPNGKVEIEHKDEARARGVASPDRAEALIMAFAQLVPKEQTFTFGGSNYGGNP